MPAPLAVLVVDDCPDTAASFSAFLCVYGHDVRAATSGEGAMKLLTGNQIGSLLAYYRAKKLFEQGVLTVANASRGVIIKTFVTTDLQKAIAEKFGLRCVETLTGFKYIGAKLAKYERALPSDTVANYRDLPEKETRRLRLEHSGLFLDTDLRPLPW